MKIKAIVRDESRLKRKHKDEMPHVQVRVPPAIGRNSAVAHARAAQRNLDPALHPFAKEREYTRAVNAAKMDKVGVG